MPLDGSALGQTGAAIEHAIDARWLMAYAASLGDAGPVYLDTSRPSGILGHPLFPACFEWPAILGYRGNSGTLTDAERLRGVHASHDLLVHRLARPGDKLRTVATLSTVERWPSGAYQRLRLDTVDAGGKPVCTTWYGTLFRGVPLNGGPVSLDDLPPWPEGKAPFSLLREAVLPVVATAAHVYTEGSRIWNPIHTDTAVAKLAGLSGIILHGTATLALCVSNIVNQECGGDPSRVRRVAARFGAMVPVPSELFLHVLSDTPVSGGRLLRFEALNSEGKPAIRDGRVLVGSSGGKT
ncbi:MAG: MaoC/PaaZ C-terminal domain-containing protein [Bdellovibrionota bacterium]